MTDGQKEKLKLRATYINGIAVAMVGVGGVAPIVSYFIGTKSGVSYEPIATAGVCVLISFCLYFIAYSSLDGID